MTDHRAKGPFRSNYLEWPINRPGRSFRVFVVEPSTYDPGRHADIFNATLTFLIAGQPQLVDPFQIENAIPGGEHFDLVTFPEAFLSAEALLAALPSVVGIPDFGCVHIGLRPSSDNTTHLFLAGELRNFVAALERIEGLERADLCPFSEWLGQQRLDWRFNVGCLFTLDARGHLRVCLHPKMVPSNLEVSPLEENHMKEATLLTAITLRPTNKRFQTITIQPLLCSDTLNLDTDRGESRPIEALHTNADCLGDNPPDHVDIVSVATCTPQVEFFSGKSGYRMWHQQFRNTFVLAASDDSCSRHHFATFILSNFHTLPEKKAGGLSGAFIPAPLSREKPHSYIYVSGWGRPKRTRVDKRWSTPEDDASAETWWTDGHLSCLNPFGTRAEAPARLLGFTVQRLPRDMSPWRDPLGLVRCTLKTAVYSENPRALSFES
jgi:hypothetical protein